MISQLLRRGALLCLLALAAACSSGPGTQPQPEANAPVSEPIFTPERLLFEQGADDGLALYDPLEGLNRRIYNFNYQFDKYIFLPAVNAYKWILPDFAETGVTNFFENFQDMTTAVNSLLQLNPEKFFQSTGRALVNSTLGVFGIFDVADTMGIPRPSENFGETLGYWGVGQGPYLVLPFLGPSNLRDGFGLLPDYYVFQYQIRKELWTKDMRTYGFLLEAVDARATTSFRYYENGSAFEYETVRRLWSTKRELDVAK